MMRCQASMVIDCTAGATSVSVTAEVPDDGTTELDVALYDSMLNALRLMAVAARSEQSRVAMGESESQAV